MSRALGLGLLVISACTFSPPPAGEPADTDAPQPVTADAAEADATAIPWLAGFSHRKSVTLLASQIEAPTDGELADFPVLVSVTDPQIAAVALASGDDIVFTADDATTLRASDIETFDKSTGQLVVWVKVPALSSNQDTKLYLYYGNPAPAAPAPEAVWTASYLGVWHLQQDPGPGNTGDILDSTSGKRNGTAQPNMQPFNLVTAKVGRGIDFDGTEDFLDFGSADLTGSFTISMWLRYKDHNSCNTMFANAASGRDTDGIKFFVNSAGMSNRRLIFEVGSGPLNTGRTVESGDGTIPLDTLVHVAAVVTKTPPAQATLFINGQIVATGAVANQFKTSSDFEFGRTENGFQFFKGALDQVEIATTQRPAEWLLTAFRNQSSPATFFTVGAEEQLP